MDPVQLMRIARGVPEKNLEYSPYSLHRDAWVGRYG